MTVHAQGRLRTAAWLLALVATTTAGCASVGRVLEPPAVELRELALLGASAERQDFRVGLLVRNPNPLPLPVRELTFTARLAGEGLLEGRSVTAVTIPAGGEQLVRVEASTDLLSSVSRLLGVVRGPRDAIPYELSGEVQLDRRLERTLRFRASGDVPLTATLGGP